jgi:drug/metabolite transporter (DMT)-like permease
MHKKPLQWLILLGLVLTWGSSFILMKRGLEVFTPIELGSLRLGLTFIFLLPFMIFRIRKIKLRKWYLFLICGLIGNGIPAFLFAYAQTGIDSSLSGILNSLTPLFTLLAGLIFFKLKTKWYNVVGVFIGLFGTVGLIAVSGAGNFEFNIYYSLFVIIATACYAVNINLIKNYLVETDSVSITAYTIGSVGFPALIYLFAGTDFTLVMQTHPHAWQGFGAVVILAVFGTGLAIMLYNYLIKITNVVFTASVTYLMPVVAIFWGIGDGEPFYLINVLWILLILGGVFLVNSRFGKKGLIAKS